MATHHKATVGTSDGGASDKCQGDRERSESADYDQLLFYLATETTHIKRYVQRQETLRAHHRSLCEKNITVV